MCKSLHTDPGTQVTELQTLRDFAGAQGMSNGVTSVLCGAHTELKSAVQGFEEMKAHVMAPAIGSMHVQQGVAVRQRQRQRRGRDPFKWTVRANSSTPV